MAAVTHAAGVIQVLTAPSQCTLREGDTSPIEPERYSCNCKT